MDITWSLPGHSRGGQIDAGVLATPLPAGRASEDAGLCYGHYVRAVEAVLKKEGWLSAVMGDGPSAQPDAAHVEILKHGHFYHPARLTLRTEATERTLVINLAGSPDGCACAEREFALLNKLAGRSAALPRVHALDETVVDGHRVVLFLGEWFDGFYEFHQTRCGGAHGVVVWDDGDHGLVSKSAEAAIYRQAAEILTRLGNPLTFELVQPWHHAAGDFVVHLEGDTPQVRLITVRQYLPMADVNAPGAEELLEGALYFLMLLSIRNRLDRYDGIGEVAWIGDHAVAATLEGFFDGLAPLEAIGPLAGPFGPWVDAYLAAQTEAELWETARAVVASFNPRATELAVVKAHLAEHAAVLYRAIQARAQGKEIK